MAAPNDMPNSPGGAVRKFSWGPASAYIKDSFQTWNDSRVNTKQAKEAAQNICAAEVFKRWGKQLLVKHKGGGYREITEEECRQVSLSLFCYSNPILTQTVM